MFWHIQHWGHVEMVPTQKNLLITEWIEALKTVITYSTRWKKKDIIREVRAKSCKNSENWEIVEPFLEFLLETNEIPPSAPRSTVWFWWKQGGQNPWSQKWEREQWQIPVTSLMWLKYLSEITEGELEGTRSRGVWNVWLKTFSFYMTGKPGEWPNQNHSLKRSTCHCEGWAEQGESLTLGRAASKQWQLCLFVWSMRAEQGWKRHKRRKVKCVHLLGFHDKCHKLGCAFNRNVLSPSSENQTFEIRMSAGPHSIKPVRSFLVYS